MKKIVFILMAALLVVFWVQAPALAATGDRSRPVMAYGTQSNRYLVVYEKSKDNANTKEIYGQIIKSDGTAYNNEFAISNAIEGNSQDPAVAYDSANQRFLVVWKDERVDPGYDIYGQLVNADGSFSGPNFPIAQATLGSENLEEQRPTLAYDSINQRFLVVWERTRIWNGTLVSYLDIYGQLVDADGNLSGVNFAIADNGHKQGTRVAFDQTNQRFLVGFLVWSAATLFDIHGQFVNADGTLFGTTSDQNFVIYALAESNQFLNSISYDSVNNRYLVTWEDDRTDNGVRRDIYGQLINADGTQNGAEIPISTAPNNQSFPVAAFDNANQRFLIAWHDRRPGTDLDIYGQFVNADGSLHNADSLTNFPIRTNPGDQRFPVVAYNSTCSNFMAAYEDLSMNPIAIQFSVVGNICPENTPPTVIAVSPANGAAGVAINTFMTATFSETMDPTTITSATFTVNGGVSGTVSYNGDTNTATFTPSANLAYGTTYNGTITTGVKDVAGNAMAANYTWSFMTANAEAGIPSAGDAPLIMGGGGCFIDTAAPGSLYYSATNSRDFIQRTRYAGLASMAIAIFHYLKILQVIPLTPTLSHQGRGGIWLGKGSPFPLWESIEVGGQKRKFLYDQVNDYLNPDKSLRTVKPGAPAMPTFAIRYLILLAASIPVSIMLILLFRRKMRNAALTLLLVSILSTYPVEAFDGHIFIPQVGEQDFIALQSSSTLEAGGVSAGFTLDYARRPVILSNGLPLSKKQLTGTVFGGLGLTNAFQIGVIFPYLLSQDGVRSDGTEAKSSAPGDIAFSAKYRLTGGGENEFGLAASAFLTAPSGAQDDWFGSRSFTGSAMFIIDKNWHKRTTATLNLGYRISKEERLSATQETGSAILFGMGLAHNLNQNFVITGEIYGNSPSADLFKEKVSPLEADLSLGYRIWGNGRIFVGAGAGLTDGVGAPDWRIMMGLIKRL